MNKTEKTIMHALAREYIAKSESDYMKRNKLTNMLYSECRYDERIWQVAVATANTEFNPLSDFCAKIACSPREKTNLYKFMTDNFYALQNSARNRIAQALQHFLIERADVGEDVLQHFCAESFKFSKSA